MACCGGNRPIMTHFSASLPNLHPVSVLPVQRSLDIQSARARTLQMGDVCVYCNGLIAEKVKKVGGTWHRVPWCPKCRLEV